MIEAEDVRVDAEGEPCIDGLTFASTADRTLILGAPRELMLAAAGMVPISRGRLLIEHEAPHRALALGRIAACPLDARLPPSWSPLKYVEWSARLAGVPKREVREIAEASLAHVGLAAPVIKAPLRRQSRVVRRATQLAAALVPAGATLLLWNPLEDLEPEAASVLEPVLVRALSAVRSVVFASRAPLDGPLAGVMGDAVVLSGSNVLAQGTVLEVAAKGRTYFVRAVGDIERFTSTLTERGARLLPGTNAAAGIAATAATAAELAVVFGPMENVDVFRAAVDADAVIIEMRPLSAAFA